MKQVTFKEINGRKVPKFRGGRVTVRFRDKTKYSRKLKHKGVQDG